MGKKKTSLKNPPLSEVERIILKEAENPKYERVEKNCRD